MAGDLLPAADAAARHRQLIATGFLALGPKVLAEPDPRKMELDIVDEQIDTLGRSVLGPVRRVRLLPADVDEHCADLTHRQRDLEPDLADRLGLASCGRAFPQGLEQCLEPFDLGVVLLS